MTHALFGTDGIRGTAGAFPLDAHTVRRVGAALVKALPHSGGQASRRPRYAGIGSVDRARAGARRAHGGRHGAQHRRRADACRRVPDRIARFRCRRRDFGVAQSVSGQRHQGILGRRREIRRRVRESHRGSRRRSGRGRCSAGDARDVPQADHLRKYMRACAGRAAERRKAGPRSTRRRLRQRRDDDGRAGAVPRARVRRHGARSGAGRPQHQQGRRIDTPGQAG